ncbi:MAG: type I polyketide synthase [Pseudomonadota bacterium]|nr:type I polyketide synthase [Pseudomonadota bacterium]
MHTDIAIIGVAGLFPGCRNKDAYWENIVRKVDNIKVAPDSWAKPWYDPERAGTTIDSGRIRTRKVGLLGELATFDPLQFGIPPKAVEGDPAHFLALQLASDALKDAHYNDRRFNREKTGIIVGHGYNPNRGDVVGIQYGLAIDQTIELLVQLFPHLDPETLEGVRAALKRSLPPMQIEQAPTLISNVISGRIANRLDLMGPNHLVDAACASTLIAVDLAIKDLLAGRSDMMVVGGVQASMPPQIYMLFESLGALSPSEIRPFDRAGNGTLLSEGVGFVVLKRLADAVRDDDRIYAVVKGVGIASDGKAMGLLAPRLEGEFYAIQRAYEQTGIDPGTIGLVEAHGTGIPLGDRTEIEALTRVFGQRQGMFPTCALGAVKSMIGHCIPASAAASLIKVSLALHYKTLPPTICGEVNPELQIDKTPFYVNSELRPWIHGGPSPRRAGIDAFGFGGINAHAILEEYREPEAATAAFSVGRWLTQEQSGVHADAGYDLPVSAAEPYQQTVSERTWSSWPTELVVFSGASRTELVDRARKTAEWLRWHTETSLAQLAYARCLEDPGDVRLAIVAGSNDELAEKLEFAIGKLKDGKRKKFASRKGIYYSEEPRPDGKVAFMFSSEGSQYPNMLEDLCLYFPKVARWFDYLDQTFPRSPLPSDCIFPAPTCLSADAREQAAAQLYAGDLATESVSTASQAFYEILRDLGVNCDAMVGHSAGENAALRAAGKARTRSLKHLQEEMRLLNKVYEELESGAGIPTGQVLSVGALDYGKVGKILDEFAGTLFLLSDNCPSQIILFATEAASKAAVERIRAEGGICIELPFDRAYHTPLFSNGVEVLRHYYETHIESAPHSACVYSCSTARPYPDDKEEGQEIAAQQWMMPVRFRETIEQMHGDGVRIFVELGASNSLTAFVDSTLKGRNYLAVAANAQGRPALEQFLHLLARLFVEKVDMDLAPMYEQRPATALDADTASEPAKQRLKLVLKMDLPRLSLDAEFLKDFQGKFRLAGAETAGSSVLPGREEVNIDRDTMLAGHFKLMREFLDSQTRVAEMLGEHIKKSDSLSN